MRIFKLQINDNNGTNHVDEVLRDSRITADLDFSGSSYDNLEPGCIVLVHKGSYPTALTKVVRKLTSEDQINGTSFGVDYRISVISYYAELPEDNPVKDLWGKVGHSGTFQELSEETSTYQQVQNWYRFILQYNRVQEAKRLLEYKKQIILQGSPGTGKTKLAEEIAENLLTKKIKRTSLDAVKDFMKSHEVTELVQKWRDIRFQSRNEFLERFPIENIESLTLEDYCIGQLTKENFCWWVERGLESYGRYFPGSSVNYYVYYNKAEQRYKTLKRYEDAEMALSDVKQYISQVIREQTNELGYKRLGTGYILRLLAIYHPKKYIHVFKHENQQRIADILKINRNHSFVELNRSIKQRIDELIVETGSNMEVDEVIHFLFRTFLGGNETEINEKNDELIISSKPTITQFHPSYSYEDFVRGISVDESDGAIVYKSQNKTLGKLAEKAIQNPGNPYVLIIDEINRANLSAVLGELIYALECRGKEVESMYAIDDNQELILPPNLFIIGTMNTADRSAGTIDYAIRRRFAFVNVHARNLLEEGEKGFASDLFVKVSELFDTNISPEFDKEDVRLGHSYFIDKSRDEEHPVGMDIRWKYEIQPILLEYVKDGILIGERDNMDIKKYILNKLYES